MFAMLTKMKELGLWAPPAAAAAGAAVDPFESVKKSAEGLVKLGLVDRKGSASESTFIAALREGKPLVEMLVDKVSEAFLKGMSIAAAAPASEPSPATPETEKKP
jgi:hypothetical protein